MFDEVEKEQVWATIKSKIVVTERDCWEWTKPRNSFGYGQYFFFGKRYQVHRMAYMLTHGVQLERSTYICHTCDNPPCVNPAHLWAGRSRDNLLDCVRKGRHQEANQTHCLRGHPLHGDNVLHIDGRRKCRTCTRARMRIYAGWPMDLAYSMPPCPPGHRPVGARFPRRSKRT